MQLAVVADYWNASRGGERYLIDLVRSISKAGHSVHVYCQECQEPAESLSVHEVPRLACLRFAGDWTFCRNVGRQLKARDLRLVLAFRPMASATHYMLPAGLYRAAFEAEREALDSRLRKWLYWPAASLNLKRRLLVKMQQDLVVGKNKPRLMTNSIVVREQLQQIYGVSSAEVNTEPPGIDLGRFHPVGTKEGGYSWAVPAGRDKLRVLFVAHNFVLKGLHCLFEALNACRHRGVKTRLRVVGNGPISKFRNLAERFGISSHVTFLGPVAQDDLVELYRSSDVLVHPTFYDPCSAVVLEALACGCPVITTRRNGASELMEAGKHGFVVDHPRNIDALVDGLRALEDCQELRRMSREAALRGRDFDLKAHAAKVMAWLGLKS